MPQSGSMVASRGTAARRCLLVMVAVVSVVAFPATAHAYLDPAAGSLVLQLLLGGLAGLAVLLKLYWRRLLSLVGIRKDSGDSTE